MQRKPLSRDPSVVGARNIRQQERGDTSQSDAIVGGGIPIARYYIPSLHARVRYREARELFHAKGWLSDAGTFHHNVCDRQECRDTLDGNIENFTLFGLGETRTVRRGTGLARIDFPTTETKLRCLRHYLQRKALEYSFAGNDPADLILDDLRRGMADYGDVAGEQAYAHLSNWAEALGHDLGLQEG